MSCRCVQCLPDHNQLLLYIIAFGLQVIILTPPNNKAQVFMKTIAPQRLGSGPKWAVCVQLDSLVPMYLASHQLRFYLRTERHDCVWCQRPLHGWFAWMDQPLPIACILHFETARYLLQSRRQLLQHNYAFSATIVNKCMATSSCRIIIRNLRPTFAIPP